MRAWLKKRLSPQLEVIERLGLLDCDIKDRAMICKELKKQSVPGFSV